MSNFVYYSDDNGETWNVSKRAKLGGDESKVVELSDGTILMSIRRQSKGPRYYTKSTDGGITWGEVSEWTEMLEPNCNGDIIRYTSVNDGYEKNRLLHSIPNDAANRRNVSVFVSYDEGQTWPVKKSICPTGSAYSSLTILPDGTIGAYVEENYDTDNMSLYFNNFSLDWLTDGADIYYAAGETEVVKSPTFSAPEGEYENSVAIELTTATDGASIYYTLDGNTPNERSILYEGLITIEETTETAFEGVDIALFSAGGSTSAKYAPYAVQAGAVVVDNTSYFRQNPNVPLVVPEVNAHALDAHNGIIACPNCSTIQMMVALEPVRQKWGLDRIIVSTYQAVSGAGMGAILETQRELKEVLNDGVNPRDVKAEILPCGGDKKHFPIAFNALAQIDVFTENDYTYEEMKMTNETKKIMEDDSIAVSATCVRIPVLSAHSESVYIETKEVAPIDEVKAAIAEFPGAVLEDDVANQVYPQAVNAVGSRDTFVGRIRKDLDAEKGIHMWVVSDNLLKGAAWNSVQIAETLHERGLVRPTSELKFELK